MKMVKDYVATKMVKNQVAAESLQCCKAGEAYLSGNFSLGAKKDIIIMFMNVGKHDHLFA